MSAYHNLTKNEQLQFLIWMEEEGNGNEIYREYEIEQAYENMLNDCYPMVEVAGYKYDVAETLKAVDPTAYRCGLADYSSEDFIELTSEQYMPTDLADERVEEFLEVWNKIIISDWAGNELYCGPYDDSEVDEVLDANRCQDHQDENCPNCNDTGYEGDFSVSWAYEGRTDNVYEFINY